MRHLKRTENPTSGVKQTAALGRLLAAAAVFFLCLLIAFGASKLLARHCPEKKIKYKDFPGLETEGLELYGKERKNGFRTTAFDSHLYIENDGRPIRSAEFYVTWLRHKKGTTERAMEVYYDTGSGFREEECVQIRLNKGLNRVHFDTLRDVKRIRVDFFNATGSMLHLWRITLNPETHYQLPAFAIFAAAALLLFVFVTRKSTQGHFALAMLVWIAFAAAAGIPFVRNGRDSIVPVFFALAVPAAFLAASLLMEEGRTKERCFTAALLVTAFALYFLFAYITPYAEGPDEAMHHDVAYYIALRGYLPAGYDPAVRNEIWGFSYAYLPILPFIIAGYLEFVLRQIFNPSFYQLYMTARMVSVASGTLTVYFTWKTAQLLFPKKQIRYFLPLFAAFLPEMAFLNSYVNSDAMAIMTTAMIVYFWASGCAHDWRYRDAAGLSVGMALCALTYYNCYGFILMSIPLFFLTVTGGKKSGREIARMTGFIVALTALLCGWWFIRNMILYDGDLLGRSTLNRYAELYAADGYKPSQILSPRRQGYSLFYMLTAMEWVSKTLRSFVAMFSHYVLRAKHGIYVFYKILFAAGAVSAAFAFIAVVRSGSPGGSYDANGGEGVFGRRKTAALRLCLLVSLAIVLGLGVYYSYAVDFQPQGRYILPMIVPLGCLLTAGFDAVLGRLPRALKKALAVTLSLSPLLAALSVFLDTVAGYYLK